MSTPVVTIDLGTITDEDSFHSTFQSAMGFPAFYGRNMDAWIDCMTNIDDPARGLTAVHVEKGEILALQLDNAKTFKDRCPALFQSLLECSGFVNWRRLKVGRDPVLALCFST